MATKTIAWTTGSGNITLTYTGQGNGSISVSSDENDSFDERSQSFEIVTTNGNPEKAVSILVKQQGKRYAVGEVFNFGYTGTVQQITLPKGKYKLQCWGAQGGTSYGSSNGAGSKGGYSEGVIKLTGTTTFYIFVGGQGSRGSSSSLVNGGWNGGGASVGYSQYKSGDTYGSSYPACGGGATDISTVTSSMGYSSGRTNRSAASMLARCIVAGGGAGGSWRNTIVTTTTESTIAIIDYTGRHGGWTSGSKYYAYCKFDISSYVGKTVTFVCSGNFDSLQMYLRNSSGTDLDSKIQSGVSSLSWTKTITSSMTQIVFQVISGTSSPTSIDCYASYVETTSNQSSSSGYSNKSQQGGGASGKGQYPGTQTSAGSGGAFGLGANQSSTNYRYCAGGGGGGWYGGGTNKSDSSTNYVNYSGGGSGFVNTAANAASRPSGYTGLQLDSGTTKDGSTSFESTSGGTETGHSGNGYARITVLEQ